MNQIFLAGSSGYIGNLICQNLSELYPIYCIDKHKLNANLKREVLADDMSPIIIYAAGNKDIQKCESDFELALDANFKYLQNVTNMFQNPYIIYLSTDYVFDGLEGNYSSDHIPNPDTNYGKSKLTAEKWLIENFTDQVNILRVSTICSQNSSFIKYLLEASEEKNASIDVAINSFFSPTSINLLLECLIFLIEERLYGVYHLSGPKTSRSEFANLVLNLYGKNSSLQDKDYKQINKYLRPDLSLKNSFLDMKDFKNENFFGTLHRIYSEGYSLEDFNENILMSNYLLSK